VDGLSSVFHPLLIGSLCYYQAPLGSVCVCVCRESHVSLVTGREMASLLNVFEELLQRGRRCYFVMAIHSRPNKESSHYSHRKKVSVIVLSNLSVSVVSTN